MAKVMYEKSDQIAYITLNRPEVHNAIDTETDELLFEAWTRFRDDRSSPGPATRPSARAPT
jgi:enoyl-CoA hydratase/carnithine racemase